MMIRFIGHIFFFKVLLPDKKSDCNQFLKIMQSTNFAYFQRDFMMLLIVSNIKIISSKYMIKKRKYWIFDNDSTVASRLKATCFSALYYRCHLNYYQKRDTQRQTICFFFWNLLYFDICINYVWIYNRRIDVDSFLMGISNILFIPFISIFNNIIIFVYNLLHFGIKRNIRNEW